MRQRLHHAPLVPHQHAQELVARLLLGGRVAGERRPCLVDVALPGVGIVDASRHGGEQPRGDPGRGDGDRVAAREQVREEHRRRVPPPYLERLDVELVVDAVQIEQQLGGLTHPRHGGEGVLMAQEREIGDGVQFEEPRAGDLEEVHHHQVGVPGVMQIGQGVEHVIGVLAHIGQQLQHVHREALETDGWVDDAGLDVGVVVQPGFADSEADVHDSAAVALGTHDEGFDDHGEVAGQVDVPHHVVPQPQLLDGLVQTRDPCTRPALRVHASTLVDLSSPSRTSATQRG
ncbi:MAG: hypothetical protein R2722_03230 [Tessaracoccus sp.]